MRLYTANIPAAQKTNPDNVGLDPNPDESIWPIRQIVDNIG
ncbi:hypothetical protein [Fluviicoccus keumensis]|nr:hypothetical protein [Fluviicoccus keumensis]